MDPKIQNQITEAISYQDSVEAIAVLNMARKNPEVKLDHQTYLRLQYVRMNSLTEYQLLGLMKQSVLAAYTIPEFTLDEKIKSYVNQMDDTLGEVKFVRDISALLQSSEEVLGQKNIVVSGVSLSPTIGHWMNDYLGIATPDGIKSAFTQLQYINTSPNVKTLSVENKEILKDLIKLNDHCLEMVDMWNSVPTPKTEAEAFKDYDLYQFIPGLDLEDDEPESTSPQSTSPQAEAATTPPVIKYEEPVVPAPVPTPANPVQQEAPQPVTPVPSQPAPQQQPTEEQLRTIEGIRLAKRTPGHYKDNNPAVSGPLTSADSAKIHDLINKSSAANSASKRGVTMDPTNIKIDEEQKRLDSERNKKSLEIQKKLSELRTRNNNPK